MNFRSSSPFLAVDIGKHGIAKFREGRWTAATEAQAQAMRERIPAMVESQVWEDAEPAPALPAVDASPEPAAEPVAQPDPDGYELAVICGDEEPVTVPLPDGPGELQKMDLVHPNPPTTGTITEDTKREAVARVEAGEDVSDIADSYGVPYQAVNAWVRKAHKRGGDS